MFENNGRKLRGIAMTLFVLGVVGAVITLLMGFISCITAGSGVLVVLLTTAISVAISLLSTWISVTSILALADAATYSQTAAYNSQEALEKLNAICRAQNIETGFYAKPKVDKEEKADEAGPAPVKFDSNRVPAWKRVELAQKEADSETCPVCGASVQAQDLFCRQCGNRRS